MNDRLLQRPIREIITRIRAGDVAAYDAVFRAYWEPLCMFANFILRDDENAREAVADLFAILWERRAEWNVTTSIEAYLFGATRNRALEMRRNATRRAGLLEHHPDHSRSASLAGDAIEHPTQLADAAELRMTIDAMLRTLPERYQEAIHLRWRRDLEYEEIAEILGTTPGAAKKLVNRALTMLRRQAFPG